MIYRRTTRRTLYDPVVGNTDIAGIKKATGAAQSAASTAAQTAGGYGANAADIASTLVPTLKNDIQNPQGFTPGAEAAQMTAGLGAAGGATSGIVGEAGLRAARSRNVGGATGVMDEAAREKMRTSAGIGLDVATKNAMLQQQQRASALQQLQGLYGTQVGAQMRAQGLVPEDIKAWADANNTGWVQNVDQTLEAVRGAGYSGGQGGSSFTV
ncbi:MAG: hypothetical protein HRJ53_13400 [Acidobacteria bacterium Pan2503]|uniref:Uncharacterized protein n=1 Tax=Candidatus Acidiferrum panamense TaxID=2741543 RepID=A0A7V8NR71_9BACT|nr:hypothetical protein [Candidatus Acidoferrum panamensis]